MAKTQQTPSGLAALLDAGFVPGRGLDWRRLLQAGGGTDPGGMNAPNMMRRILSGNPVTAWDFVSVPATADYADGAAGQGAGAPFGPRLTPALSQPLAQMGQVSQNGYLRGYRNG